MIMKSFFYLFYFTILTSISLNYTVSSYELKNGLSRPKVKVPKKLIVGYANWDECDEKIVKAVKNGVNVVIWFSINLLHNSTTGKPYIGRGPDPDCVSRVYAKLKVLRLETVHLISIGGWSSPHPDTRNTAREHFAEFARWNREEISRPDVGFWGYDGIDWDIEGNDNFTSKFNNLTVKCLDLMGEYSQLAKKSGFVVSMAPAETYLDPTTSIFNRNLYTTLSDRDKEVCKKSTTTHGWRNPYAYLISKYGSFKHKTNRVETFDFVTTQLYQGCSKALHNITRLGQPGSEYILNIVNLFDKGWQVDFSKDVKLGWKSGTVRVKASRLVVGLANGWADNKKFLLVDSKEVGLGYQYLNKMGKEVKGFAFWNIADEGRTIASGKKLWLAKDLNDVLNIRDKK